MTWRNFNVVPNVPPPGAEMIAQAFLMAGAFDRTRRMRLEVVLRLPRGSKAELRLPKHLVEYFLRNQAPFLKVDDDDTVRVPLNPSGIRGMPTCPSRPRSGTIWNCWCISPKRRGSVRIWAGPLSSRATKSWAV